MLSPEYKVKQEIINLTYRWDNLTYRWEDKPLINLQSDDEVQELYEDMDNLWDAISEVRQGELDTEVVADYSRHYESKSVAYQCVDGSWVGWTYWYGGGKHGESESIDWIPYAYYLDCHEEEKLVLVREFSKKEKENV